MPIALTLAAAALCFGDSSPAALFPRPVTPVGNAFCDVLLAGDLDGDAHSDAATVSSTTLYVARGDGQGGFALAGQSSAGDFTVDLALCDANVDGHLDTVLLSDGGLIRVAANSGAGTFGEPVPLTQELVAPYFALAAGDVDADGDVDLVAAGANLRLHYGTGSGGFALPVQYSLAATASDLAFGNLDGVGGLELAIAEFAADAVELYTVRPDGILQYRGMQSVVPSPRGLAAANFDGDAFADLLVTTPWLGGAYAYRGSAAGQLALSGHMSGIAQPRGPLAVDLDGDALTDALVSDATAGGALHIAHAVGGTLAPAQHWAHLAGAAAVAVGNFDGDGEPDPLVSGSITNPGLLLAVAGTPGALGEILVGSDPVAMAAADLERDGDPDLVVIRDLPGGADAAEVYRNDGGLQFALAATATLDNGAVQARAQLIDYDGDGLRDLVVQAGAQVTVYRGTGGSFGPGPLASLTAADFMRLAVVDVGGDARPELAVLGFNGLTFAVNSGQTGTLAPQTIGYGSLSASSSRAIGDADGDARAEVVLGKGGVAHVFDVVGSALSEIASFPATATGHMQLADLDGDGDADLVAPEMGSVLAVHRGQAPAMFGPSLYAVGGGSEAAHIADFDGDGALDVLSRVGVGLLRLTRTTTAGSLLATESYFAGGNLQAASGSRPMAVADFDGDGDLDLAFATIQGGPPRVVLVGNLAGAPGPAGGGIVGAGCAGSNSTTPSIAVKSAVAAGTLAVAITIQGAKAGAPGLLAVGLLAPALPPPAPCASYLALPFAGLLPLGTATQPNGAILATASLPAAALPPGLAVQAFFADALAPNGFHATPAATLP